MNELDYGFEVKAIDEAGYISGIAAVYGNVDRGGDMLMRGAMTKSVAGRATIPMLRQHDHRRVIGSWLKFEEHDHGLEVEGRLAMKTAEGREAHALVECGALPGLSIGYKTVRHQMNGRTRQLHELDLWEVSLVPVPMNDRSVVTSIKSILADGDMPTVRDFEGALRELGFSKTKAAAFATTCTPLLRGEPEAKAIPAPLWLPDRGPGV